LLPIATVMTDLMLVAAVALDGRGAAGPVRRVVVPGRRDAVGSPGVDAGPR
jgi:hypothetical protein